MKLKNFIHELEKIYNNLDNPDQVDVLMADYISVVKPIFKDNVVFITDIEEKTRKVLKNKIKNKK